MIKAGQVLKGKQDKPQFGATKGGATKRDLAHLGIRDLYIICIKLKVRITVLN